MAKVLVAGDEPDIRQLPVNTLFDAGYDVVEAEDGGSALRKACLEHPGHYPAGHHDAVARWTGSVRTP